MRVLIETLDEQFDSLDRRQRILLEKTDERRLFWTPVSAADSMITLSVGGGVLRSAAMVEQLFLGLTRRLWDDPFEWTLPEKLDSVGLIREYLDEVDRTRESGISFIASDDSLSKAIPAPVKITPISQILIDTLARSEHYLGRAYAVFQMISDEKLPRIESF